MGSTAVSQNGISTLALDAQRYGAAQPIPFCRIWAGTTVTTARKGGPGDLAKLRTALRLVAELAAGAHDRNGEIRALAERALADTALE